MTSEQELRESIIKQIEDVFIKQTDGVWQQPFTVNEVKDIVRGKQVYPWAYMFEVLLVRARQMSVGITGVDHPESERTELGPNDYLRMSDLERIIKDLTCPTK